MTEVPGSILTGVTFCLLNFLFSCSQTFVAIIIIFFNSICFWKTRWQLILIEIITLSDTRSCGRRRHKDREDACESELSALPSVCQLNRRADVLILVRDPGKRPKVSCIPQWPLITKRWLPKKCAPLLDLPMISHHKDGCKRRPHRYHVS